MGNMSFDESSSNFAQQAELPVIPGIHVPLQVDDRASRDVLYSRSESSNKVVEPSPHSSEQEDEEQTMRIVAGARASTSTSAGPPLNGFDVGWAEAPLKPPKDINLISPLPTNLGPMPYNHLYGNGPGGFKDEFRVKYKIPDDVLVERVTGDRISFSTNFVIVPLYAITGEGGGGGVRFPMSPFLRYFLESYNLAPIQVSMNTWRILCSAMRLPRLNNQPFPLGDLMLIEMRNVLVGVSNKFEWGPIDPLLDIPFPSRTCMAVERPYNISRVWGFPGYGEGPDCSALNKGLYVTGSFAHCKNKSKMVRKPVDLASVVGEALRDQFTTQDLSTSNLPNTQWQPPPEQHQE
ncbi:hypothetical protein RHSIM_Rhsim10G0118900 [Rhododendron simsii]|uniref:Uncharacterized protein n=1 Tax=Rhododendron simsii TaxID=118357 RepID=A0A834GFA5_RHOSS|nr:hypothetical protein RHSIM_Rhsim10G0118900 [Rhododendron simsii]